MGREFNHFEVKDSTFEEIRRAVLKRWERKRGLDPRLGKYHLTACSKCHTKYRLESDA